MFYILLLLSFFAIAAGVVVAGFGIAIRETSLGASLLIVGSIVIMGGFILVGLAAAVRELQRVVHGLKVRLPVGPRPVRPADRRDAQRRDGERIAGADRRMEPRLPTPGTVGTEAPDVIPIKLDAPDPQRLWTKPGPEWLRPTVTDIEATPQPGQAMPGPDDYRAEETRRLSDGWLRTAAPQLPDDAETEVRHTPAVSSPNLFDTVWPSDHRANVESSERADRLSEMPTAQAKSPPIAPAPPAAPTPAPPVQPERIQSQPLPVLKSGVIDEMAYTLFTDGSIEATTPGGTMRFASIEALRKHLQNSEGGS